MNIARICQYLFGMVIIYLGTTLAVKSTIGAGFWSALFVGLSESLPFSIGVWFAVSQVIIVFLNAYLLKGRPEWLAFVPICFESIIFDFWLEVVFKDIHFDDAMLLTRIGIFLFALVIASFGIALYVLTGLPRSPIDQLFISIAHRFRWEIGASQTVVAITVTSIAFLLGGPVGVGTVISVFLIGPFIQFWLQRISKVYRLQKSTMRTQA